MENYRVTILVAESHRSAATLALHSGFQRGFRSLWWWHVEWLMRIDPLLIINDPPFDVLVRALRVR